jgi:hypothetical protein
MTIAKQEPKRYVGVTPAPQHVGMRFPGAVVTAMDAFCREHAITRTDLIVGLVSKHLGIRSPAEIALEKKP